MIVGFGENKLAPNEGDKKPLVAKGLMTFRFF